MKLFDAHNHLQDPRIYNISPIIIKTALDAGVKYMAVNGVSEKDWQLVKEMSDSHLCILPNYGLHPWFINERTPNWLNNLREFLEANPESAVGEIGLDRAPWASHADYSSQLQIFRQQLQVAKELKRPASVHCVEAFDDLMDIFRSMGPFPAGVILHSYMGSADLVLELTGLGAYFSISGHLMQQPNEENRAKKMLQSIPLERILLESDAPDALPKTATTSDFIFSVGRGENSTSNDVKCSENYNHPANIGHVLDYVAALLEIDKEELAEISYQNATRIFSFAGSKISP